MAERKMTPGFAAYCLVSAVVIAYKLCCFYKVLPGQFILQPGQMLVLFLTITSIWGGIRIYRKLITDKNWNVSTPNALEAHMIAIIDTEFCYMIIWLQTAVIIGF